MRKMWKITLRIFRLKEGGAPHYDEFKMDADPDEYVLDAVERVWAFQDRSLCFRHACHHSTCGACGMRVNGLEKLTCITQIRSVASDGDTIRIEPLRNFPIISDLAVDMGSLYSRMDLVSAPAVLPITQAEVENPASNWEKGDELYLRLADCLECGMCVSACPVALTTDAYLGPAVLSGAQASGLKDNPMVLKQVDSEDGVWRCHSAFECTAVCPSFVDPARRIMALRTEVVSQKIKRLFGKP